MRAHANNLCRAATDLHAITHAMTDQCATDRRHPADEADSRICFIFADDLKCSLATVIEVQLHRDTKADHVRQRRRCDDAGTGAPLSPIAQVTLNRG